MESVGRSPLTPRQGDLAFTSHLVLALAMSAWRVFEALPGLSAESGGRFSSSQAGRLCALATLLVAGSAGLGVAASAARHWRDARVLALSITLGLALLDRRRVDVFDLLYVGLALALAAWWWKSERAELARGT